MQDLPIGMSEFSELRAKNRLYIDKTKHIYSLLNKNSRVFLSRPRRFGKSLLLSTLECALKGERELFKGLWIDQSDYDWKSYGVIRLDFSQLNVESVEAFKKSFFDMLEESADLNNVKIQKTDVLGVFFRRLISKLHSVSKTKTRPVALLIDEYDYPILHSLHDICLAKQIREVIKGFSSIAKAKQKCIHFVFVTGVSAFSKAGLSSGLNNLDNITMDEHFSSICGYTDIEVDTYFKEYIEEWSRAKQIPYETLRKELKSWYNGYCFKEDTATIYSPYTFTLAIKKRELQNFWFESATPQILLDELYKEERKNECKLLSLDELQGSWDLLQTFEIENIPLPALLFQMGYLTIDSYNPLSRNYSLRYPNVEVKASLNKHLLTALAKQPISVINPLLGDIRKYLLEGNVEELVRSLGVILSNIPYLLHIEEEKYYHSLLQTIFFATGIETQSERSTSIGRMDLILDLPNTIYIIELKINLPPEEGLAQIESQKYHEPFLHKKKQILCLGLSFIRKKSSFQEKSQFILKYALKTIQIP